MANKVLKTRIALRKDTNTNWKLIENTFIPLNGEVCLIDFGYGVIRAKIGDGETVFKNVPFVDQHSIVTEGYYDEQTKYFFSEKTFTNFLERDERKLYIDIPSSEVFYYKNNQFFKILNVAKVDSGIAGITKLYSGNGQNVDGTMTQKAITDSISAIKFAVSNSEEECLVLNKPW